MMKPDIEIQRGDSEVAVFWLRSARAKDWAEPHGRVGLTLPVETGWAGLLQLEAEDAGLMVREWEGATSEDTTTT